MGPSENHPFWVIKEADWCADCGDDSGEDAYEGAGLTGNVYANCVEMSRTDFDKVDEACKCRSCMPSDHPWRVENVYAMDAIVLFSPAFRIESAMGALEVCDLRDVSRYGDRSWIFSDSPLNWSARFCVSSCWRRPGSGASGANFDGPLKVYRDTRTFFVAVSR